MYILLYVAPSVAEKLERVSYSSKGILISWYPQWSWIDLRLCSMPSLWYKINCDNSLFLPVLPTETRDVPYTCSIVLRSINELCNTRNPHLPPPCTPLSPHPITNPYPWIVLILIAFWSFIVSYSHVRGEALAINASGIRLNKVFHCFVTHLLNYICKNAPARSLLSVSLSLLSSWVNW